MTRRKLLQISGIALVSHLFGFSAPFVEEPKLQYYLRKTSNGIALESDVIGERSELRTGFIQWVPEIKNSEDLYRVATKLRKKYSNETKSIRSC